MPTEHSIILYDGVCGFCNRTVQFIIKRDSGDRFRFATQQSEFARALLQKHQIDNTELETLYLILDNGLPAERVLARSTAVIAIYRKLGQPWKFLAAMYARFPNWLRDWAYNVIARNRYRVFGKYDTCPIPKLSDRHKFLDVA